MALSDGEIEWALDIGALVIDPEPPRGADGRIKGACADLLLDDTLWVPQSGRAGDFTLNLDSIDSEQFILDHSDEHKINETQGYDLLPKGFIIGRTAESIQLGTRLSGRVEGRSRYARLGIGVHVTAPKIDPGFLGQITLEIFNLGLYKCKLTSGMAIATLMLDWLGEPAKWAYDGAFQGQ